ncbi:MAG: hypothetical protein J6M60_07720 [Clostridia bacterium]|nr:hypothetical protein [Clostridia bacterium]
MKKENGITLMSLIIYIILMLLVVAMLATMSTMFFKNTKIIEDESKYSGEFNKFNMFFIEDVKKSNSVYSINPREIVFLDGTTYAYQNNAIYRDKVKICDNITSCTFSNRTDDMSGVNKEIINVKIEMSGSDTFVADNDYVLKYW